MEAAWKIEKAGKKLIIEGDLPSSRGLVKISLFSERNATVSKLSDKSPDNPEKMGGEDPNLIIGEIGDSDIWYPVVDVALEEGMTGKVDFGPQPGTYAVNGMFHRESFAVESFVDIPYGKLEHWENSLFVKPAGVELKRFSLCLAMEIGESSARFSHEFRLLSNDWQGRVEVTCTDKDGESPIASAIIDDLPKNSRPEGKSENRTPESALRHCVDYILNSQNDNPFSKTDKGLNLFYDLDARTYRTTTWIWSWGPAIKLLLDYAHSGLADGAGRKDVLIGKADEMGMKSTMFQVDRPGHVTDGLGSTRWDPKHFSNVHNDYGYIELIAGGADSNFLSGWVWIPLYRETGNNLYLRCAEKLARTTDRLINQYDIVPQDYISDIDEWTDRTLNESVFGMEGLAELYLATGSDEFKATGKKYIDQHIDKLYREDGLWDFFYYTNTGKRELIMNTRGQGWAMEGLLAAHKMMPEGQYLKLAEQLADHIITHQHEEGYLTCVLGEPAEIVGMDDKSTPLWSMLLYRLYRFTRKKKHLEAARKALNWCIENQYLGDDEHARGGLVGVNRFSGVATREWYPITCLYSSAFFGHALLEEIAIQKG